MRQAVQKQSRTRRDESVESVGSCLSNRTPFVPSHRPHPILQMQKAAGNQAAQRLLTATLQPQLRSDSPGNAYNQETGRVSESWPDTPVTHDNSPSETRALAGSCAGVAAQGDDQELLGGFMDTLRDIGDVVSTGLGNVVGAGAALLSGIDISTTDAIAPAWTPHGKFRWRVNWNMSGRNVGPTTNGWLVQHVANTYSGEDSAGHVIDNARVGATPSYYEAWPVVAGAVQNPPPVGGAGYDEWKRPNLSTWHTVADPSTKGRWSEVSEVYFTTTDPTAHGLAPHNVADAGILPSAVAAPPDLGFARLHRYAHGTWDSTTLIPTHTGGNR